MGECGGAGVGAGDRVVDRNERSSKSGGGGLAICVCRRGCVGDRGCHSDAVHDRLSV